MAAAALAGFNFPAWKFAMLVLLDGLGVLNYIDGSFGTAEDDVCMASGDGGDGGCFSPARDKLVMALIISTLSAPIVAEVTGCATARDLWVRLEQKFGFLDPFGVLCLENHLRVLKLGDSVADYVISVEKTRAELAAYGMHITDADLIVILKANLPGELRGLDGDILIEFYTNLVQEFVRIQKDPPGPSATLYA